MTGVSECLRDREDAGSKAVPFHSPPFHPLPWGSFPSFHGPEPALYSSPCCPEPRPAPVPPSPLLVCCTHIWPGRRVKGLPPSQSCLLAGPGRIHVCAHTRTTPPSTRVSLPRNQPVWRGVALHQYTLHCWESLYASCLLLSVVQVGAEHKTLSTLRMEGLALMFAPCPTCPTTARLSHPPGPIETAS